MSDTVDKVTQIREYARERLIAALPEYEVMVRSSDSPEDYGKFVDRLTRLAGIRDEGDRENLPVFNITIAAGGIKTEVIDVTPVQAETTAPPPLPDCTDEPTAVPAPQPLEPAPQPFVLDIAPIE
jgi:hypothetical protein